MAYDEATIEKEIRDLVAEILETEPESIDPNAQFVKDLGMDSMMALEILAGIEKKFKVIIPEEKIGQFTDLNQTIAHVKEILQTQGDS